MKILIVRHGDPDYSIDSLTEKGWREAELLAKRLAGMKIDAFYVSPLGRAQDTLRPTLKLNGMSAETLPWLEEFRGEIVDPRSGRMEIPWDLTPQYWTRQPDLYHNEAWRDHALYKGTNVGEIYDETAAGMEALLAKYGYTREAGFYRCAENKDITICIVCHFALGMNILAHMMHLSLPVMWQCFFLPTSSVTTLVTEERRPGEVFFKCMQMGDTSHLYAGGEPVSRSGLYPEFYDPDWKD